MPFSMFFDSPGPQGRPRGGVPGQAGGAGAGRPGCVRRREQPNMERLYDWAEAGTTRAGGMG